MKVLQITYSQKGGAGIAAKRLHDSLQKNGISSGFLSTNLTINFKNELINDDFFKYKKPGFLKRIRLKLLSFNFLSKKNKLKNKINDLKKTNNFEIISSPYASYKLHNHPLVLEADIINLHWVSGILDYTTFFNFCNKPIVWTFHDMNPFLGVFHYKNDFNNASIDLKNINKIIQNIQFHNISKIKKGVIISPSKWLLNEAIESNFFLRFKMKKIVNSIDLEIFKIKDKKILRNKYLIPNDEFIILFVAEDVKNFRKGFDMLLESLKHLKKINYSIITIGVDDNKVYENIKVVSFGRVYNLNKIVDIYNLADVFILPSREDNLPNVILESFATGLPIISFNVGGIKEHVFNNKTGYISKELNGYSLGNEILRFYNSKDHFDAFKIRKYAEDKFSYSNQYKDYVKVYKKLLVDD